MYAGRPWDILNVGNSRGNAEGGMDSRYSNFIQQTWPNGNIGDDPYKKGVRQSDVRRSEKIVLERKGYQISGLSKTSKDPRGHTNLGAMLHLNGKYKEAEHSYKKALKLQPDDETTLTNLHRLYGIMT
ncbi:hypothetical protein HUJ04_011136 [Dendroctonus ponderosae]|nr:hypothetical protein HUJ04_011136 [Dendroctonus ponderosae]